MVVKFQSWSLTGMSFPKQRNGKTIAGGRFRNSSIIHNEKQKKLMFNECLYNYLIQKGLNLTFNFNTKVNPNLNTNTILHCTRSLSRTIRFGRLKEHKNKGKVIWVIPKVITVAYWSGHLRDLFITKFKGQMNQNSDFFFSFEFTVH